LSSINSSDFVLLLFLDVVLNILPGGENSSLILLVGCWWPTILRGGWRRRTGVLCHDAGNQSVDCPGDGFPVAEKIHSSDDFVWSWIDLDNLCDGPCAVLECLIFDEHNIAYLYVGLGSCPFRAMVE